MFASFAMPHFSFRKTGIISTLLFFTSIGYVGLSAQTASRPRPAEADSIEEAVILDRFVITDTGSLETTLPVREVSSITGFDVPYQDIPRSVIEVNVSQLTEDPISNFNDFARYAPSVNANTGELSQHFGSPSIRGAVSDLYQNGVRSMVRQGNTRPFQINAYEAVDVVAGPAPVIFGPSARTAGYVNFITKKPYFDKQRTTLNATLGRAILDGDGGYQNLVFQIDHGGPIIPNKLAYRVSYQEQESGSWYRGGFNDYRDLYTALAWLPGNGWAVDWNAELGSYEYQPTGAWNRVTQDLIDHGAYLAGPATPIIRGSFSPTGFYSPVWNPAANGGRGGFDGQSFIARTPDAANNKYLKGAALTGAPTQAQAGTVATWVLDPELLTPTKISGRDTLINPDTDVTDIRTRVFNTQLRVKKRISDSLTLFSNAYYQYYWTDSHQNGGFYNGIRSDIFEERLEIVTKKPFRLFGKTVFHQSNTGLSFRFDEVNNVKDSDASAVGTANSAYDITADPAGVARNALFGVQVYPLYWADRVVESPYFGWLAMPSSSVPSPFNPNYSVTPGGSGSGLSATTNHTRQRALSLYTHHSFAVGEHWIWEIGLRETVNWVKISSPLSDPTYPLSVEYGKRTDSTTQGIPAGSTSLSYKPVPWLTAYLTYAYVQAQNGMTTGTPTWATMKPANFHSRSVLYEGGVKTELIPAKLFSTLTLYQQTRDLSVVSYDGEDKMAKGLYRGVEFSLRYQPFRELSLGLGYNYLGANYVRNNAGSTATVADGETALLGNVSGYRLPPGDYRITNLPRNTASLYATWLLPKGFGLRGDFSIRDSYIITGDGSIVIPSAHNLNASVFYQHSRWRLSVDFTNVTNERTFNGTVQVEPIGVQTRLTVHF